MKKIIVLLMATLSVVSCKKGEISDVSLNEIVDSATSVANSMHEDIPHELMSDTMMTKLKDSAQSVLIELKKEKELLTEKVAKEIDLASKEVIVSQIETAQNKIDSVKQEVITVSEKMKATPKIIKETKVIYRDAPAKVVKTPAVKVSKSGEVQMRVNDMDVARQTVRDQIRKYGGVVKSEQITSDAHNDASYLKVSFPAEKTEYFINDLERYVGSLEYRDISMTGDEYDANSVCNLEIALFQEGEKAVAVATPETFGVRMGHAISSGWDVIQEIFLFVLPFWPVFLIGGGFYYYFKRKNVGKNVEEN